MLDAFPSGGGGKILCEWMIPGHGYAKSSVQLLALFIQHLIDILECLFG
jgi:hypothetical protein